MPISKKHRTPNVISTETVSQGRPYRDTCFYILFHPAIKWLWTLKASVTWYYMSVKCYIIPVASSYILYTFFNVAQLYWVANEFLHKVNVLDDPDSQAAHECSTEMVMETSLYTTSMISMVYYAGSFPMGSTIIFESLCLLVHRG